MGPVELRAGSNSLFEKCEQVSQLWHKNELPVWQPWYELRHQTLIVIREV